MRRLAAQLAVLVLVVAALVATGVGDFAPAPSQAAERAQAARATPALSTAVAVRQMRQFFAAATQVTAVGGQHRIEGCRRRGPRVLDCQVAVAGRTTVSMRARLLGKRAPRVQLYVLRVGAAR